MQKVIVIIGPTASGKSKLAMKLASDLNAEIINADCFQVYKELNIGVNKPNSDELKKIKHYLINDKSIYEQFDIKIFQDSVNKLINQMAKKQKNIILCGGSNLYIDAIIKGYNLNKTIAREKIHYFDQWNYDDIYNYVVKKDPEEAKKIGYQNQRRIIRAAQIIYSTNNKKSIIDQNQEKYIYDCFIIQTNIERKLLYEIIDQRAEAMIKNNWMQEVKKLVEKDSKVVNLPAFKAIGYTQIYDALINHTEIDIDKIKKNTRNLAKKQLTWCHNKYKNANYFVEYNLSNGNYLMLLNQIKIWLNK